MEIIRTRLTETTMSLLAYVGHRLLLQYVYDIMISYRKLHACTHACPPPPPHTHTSLYTHVNIIRLTGLWTSLHTLLTLHISNTLYAFPTLNMCVHAFLYVCVCVCVCVVCGYVGTCVHVCARVCT